MKLKNIINRSILPAFIATGLCLFTASCDDMLDTKPQGAITANEFDDDSVESLLVAAYAGLQAHFFGNNEAFDGPITNWVFDVRSDDAYKGGGALSMEEGIHQVEMNNFFSDNVVALNKWRNGYYAIARCNDAIEAIQDAEGITDAEGKIAELKTLRAYFYFDLVRLFKNLPYFIEGQLGATASPYEYSREQIFEFIKADLAAAYEALPATQSQAGRFNKYVAAAIHAKVSATLSEWQDVVKYSDYIISSGQYQLYNNFLDMSKIEFNNQFESIMAVQFSTANNNANINWCNLLNTTYSDGDLYGSGDDFFLGSQNLVNAYATDFNGLPYLDKEPSTNVSVAGYNGSVDPRVDFTVGRIGVPFRGHMYNSRWCRAYDLYGEYSGKKGLVSPEDPLMVEGFPWGASPLNFIIIRYADILLLKAEALIEQGTQLDEARELVNQIRRKAARSVSSTYTPVDINPSSVDYYVDEYPAAGWSQDYARKAVRMERRLELAMEGHRWFDLVRWGVAVEVMNKYYQTESRIHSYLSEGSLSENEILFDIPLDEVQNSGGLYNK